MELVHSQHSGKYYRAVARRIDAHGKKGYQKVTARPLDGADALVEFSATTARNWRLTFQLGPSQKDCLRGLQYFAGKQQLFPPGVPYQWQKKLGL
jgi:hypothetical protein